MQMYTFRPSLDRLSPSRSPAQTCLAIQILVNMITEQCCAHQRSSVCVAGRGPTYRDTSMQPQIACRINVHQHFTSGRTRYFCSQTHGRLKVGPGIVLAVSCMTRLHWMVETELKPYGRARPDGPQIRKMGDFLIWGHVARGHAQEPCPFRLQRSTLAPHVQVSPES
jgi:hypothetical protein